MSSPSLKPSAAVVLAVLVAMAAFSVAAIADSVVARLVAVFVGGALVVFLVRSAGAKSSGAGLAGVALVPMIMLGVGTALVGALAPGSGSAGSDYALASPGGSDWSSGLLHDRFTDALDHADTMTTNGSASLLRLKIELDGDVYVDVFDAGSGRRLSARTSNGNWQSSDPTTTSERVTFGRADMRGLNLDVAGRNAMAAADKLGVKARDGDVTIERRSEIDRKLVVTFPAASFRTIQVGMDGKVADTVDAGSLDTVIASAVRTMTAAGLDPRSRDLDEIQFMSIADGADSISATSVQNSGGIDLDFDGGPVSEIKIVPGEFPVIHVADEPRKSDDDAFAITSVKTSVLKAIRSDLIKKHSLPRYDWDLIGLMIGSDHSDDDATRAVMRVGTSESPALATYTLSGGFVHPGR